jgi:predicted amidohydrolase YtcJ
MAHAKTSMKAATFTVGGGPCYSFDPSSGRWETFDGFVVSDGRVVSLRSSDAGAGIPHIDLRGRTALPAFADCHVHLTDTGLFLNERDLGNVTDAKEFSRAIESLPRTRFVLAGNYDEARWTDGAAATAEPLERAHPDAIAMAVRVDAHSCVVNRRTLAWLDFAADTEGIERDADGAPTGRLFLDANWRAQAAVLRALPPQEKRAADRRATKLALRAGALHLHVQLVGLPSREAYGEEIASMPRAGPAKWHPKICEPDPQLAHDFGLPYVGGDVFLDGSLGSGTAALIEPYCDRPGRGRLMHEDADVHAYFAAAERVGVSAGVHAIGDRAIEQCLAAWEEVLGGEPSPINRHFIEHFELSTPQQIARCARLGIYLSMQPQFDAAWGHPGGMYDERLGAARARGMNALGSAKRAGAIIVGGDDSPVCALSPLDGMRAALAHHNAGERLGVEDALTMYTYDAARFAHAERTTGRIAPGLAADIVLLDGDPIARGSFDGVTVAATWANGRDVTDANPGIDVTDAAPGL